MTLTVRGVSNKHCLLTFFIYTKVGYNVPTLHGIGSHLKQVTEVLPSHTLVFNKHLNTVSACGCMLSHRLSDSLGDRIPKVCIHCMGGMLSTYHLYVLERHSCYTMSAGWGTYSSLHSLLGLSQDNPDLVFSLGLPHDNPDPFFHWACLMIIQILFFTGLVT